ncbi:adenine phosphoribosyltransferase, partial [Candidatus Woesearchaeota archaeon]|nr:adenine phosphoribosyltransferase [Candidatus Woesearchaeota archaeon]
MEAIKSKIRTIPHFPKQGIMFRDITTLLKDAQGFRKVIDEFVQRYTGADIDVVVGLEARGFILGGAIAHQLGKGFVPIRKAGKLPGKTVRHEYELEYGTDKIEMHEDSIHKGSKVLIVDDLLATGGTALAAATLIEKLGGVVVEMAFIVDLPEVGGQKKIKDKG